MNQQRALVFDIETQPILAYVWGLKDQNISLNQIHTDWSVMAWGAKWLGESAVMYLDRSTHTELALLKGIWKLLDQADIVITQNGKSFDSKRLNARFIHYGMRPPNPYKHIDTYLVARGVADFTSNKLEYLTNKLCKKYKKLDHGLFPGMSLWTECLKGNKKAWLEMRKYNIHDVLSTEELYEALKAWAPGSVPSVFVADACGRCNSRSFQNRGWGSTNFYRYRKQQCKQCGAWKQGKREKLNA